MGLYGLSVIAGIDNISNVNTLDSHTGEANTTVLCSSFYRNYNDGIGSIGSPAALYCREELSKAYDLPNKEELNLIYTNKSNLTNIEGTIAFIEGTSTTYTLANISNHIYSYIHSSSNKDGFTFWVQNFNTGARSADAWSACYKNDGRSWAIPVRRIPA